MADAAIARREARRKRILENSHNRLQLISGKINEERCRDSLRTPILDENVEIPVITEVNTVDTCFVNNGVSASNLETFTSENNAEDFNDLTAFLPPTPEHAPSQDPSLIAIEPATISVVRLGRPDRRQYLTKDRREVEVFCVSSEE